MRILFLRIRTYVQRHPREVMLFLISFGLNALVGMTLYLWLGVDFITRFESDSFGYLELGKNIAEGKGFVMEGIVSALRPPLYPLYVSLPYVLGIPPAWLVLGQYLFAAVSAVLIYRIGVRVFSKRVGTIAALLFTMEPYTIILNSTAATESLFLLLILLGVLFLFRGFMEEWPIRSMILSGVCFGLATLTRPTALYIPVFFFFHHSRVATLPKNSSSTSDHFFPAVYPHLYCNDCAVEYPSVSSFWFLASE